MIEFVTTDSLIRYQTDGWGQILKNSTHGYKFERDGRHLWIVETPQYTQYFIFTSRDTLYSASSYTEIRPNSYYTLVTEQ